MPRETVALFTCVSVNESESGHCKIVNLTATEDG